MGPYAELLANNANGSLGIAILKLYSMGPYANNAHGSLGITTLKLYSMGPYANNAH
jgi:hypothetical protein